MENNIHPILTIHFNNMLGTLEAEILKYLRTFSLSSKIRRSYNKKSVCSCTISCLLQSCSPALKSWIVFQDCLM